MVGAALGAVLALSVAACVRKIWAADFWWQHAAGRYVAENGWPTLDVFSYTAADRPWMEMRWLFCLAQYRAEEWFGPGALIVLKWLAVVAAFALVSLPVARRESRLTLAAIWTVALLASSQRFFVRPELVSYVLIGFFVWVLHSWVQATRSGSDSRWPIRALYLLPVVQVLWVNAHPLFVFGPLLVGLGLTVALGRLALSKVGSDARVAAVRDARTLGAVLAATTLACLLNPYGVQGALHPLLLFSEMRGSIFSEAISELRSPFSFGAAYTAVFWYKALIGLCVVSAAVNLRGSAQDVTGYPGGVSRVAYPYSQPIEVLVVTQRRHDIPQTIVATMTATPLETRGACRNVQLIVRNQDFLGCDLVEICHRRHGLAAAVHESGGN